MYIYIYTYVCVCVCVCKYKYKDIYRQIDDRFRCSPPQVVVLLSLMLWGTLWGVPGLVLAVPLTAVLRIHLASIDHPLPRCLYDLNYFFCKCPVRLSDSTSSFLSS